MADWTIASYCYTSLQSGFIGELSWDVLGWTAFGHCRSILGSVWHSLGETLGHLDIILGHLEYLGPCRANLRSERHGKPLRKHHPGHPGPLTLEIRLRLVISAFILNILPAPSSKLQTTAKIVHRAVDCQLLQRLSNK